jgi:hypothetical protein
MFCIIAFVILSILGIFSATNRHLAHEALDCVFRRITFRPCNTGFDEKMKAKILGKIINRSERAARFLNKNFEILSWVFFVLLLGSSIWAVRGIYLYYVSGSCNGLNQTAFCLFDPTGKNNDISGISSECLVNPINSGDLSLNGIDISGFPVIHSDSTDKIVFIGSYGCDYTRQVYPMVKKLAEDRKASFFYLDYPTKETSDLLSRVGYVVYQMDTAAYWKLNDILFSTDKSNLADTAFIETTLTSLGLDAASIMESANSSEIVTLISNQLTQITNTNFYGTPTVFINGTPLVGPKPYRVYAIELDGLLYWVK